jgi:hypothetical protein
MAETNDLRPEHSLVEGLSAFQPRLVSRASSLQRQEVRGGFPVPMEAEARDDADTSSDDPRGGQGAKRQPFGMIERWNRVHSLLAPGGSSRTCSYPADGLAWSSNTTVKA